MNSTILHLPAVSSRLASNGYSVSELTPYGGLYSTCGNPYDFSDGTVSFGNNGTTYLVCECIVTSSRDGLVIGAWVAPGSITIGKIFAYDTAGPGGLNYGGPGLAPS